MDIKTGDYRTGDLRSSDSKKSVELNSEEFKIIQAQITNLTQQLSIAQTVSTKEKARAEELKGMAERLQADFTNHRKRTDEMSKKLREDGQADAIEKVLPLADILRQAVALVKDEKTQEGLKLVLRQFMRTLEEMGVTEIPALGEKFDPNIHNAVADIKVKNPEDQNIIVEVYQKGYRLKDRILRYSDVKVGR